MQSVDATTLLLQLGILFAAALLLGRLADRLGLPSTTGELAAGLLLGPSVLGGLAAARDADWLFRPEDGQLEPLRALAIFCGVLLIGIAGATLNVGFVRSRARTIGCVGAGALGIPLVVTVLVALVADERLRGPAAGPWTFAVFAGLAMSVSAVPVMVKIFADLRVLHRDLSQLSLSVAVIDDATVWVGLSVIAGVVHAQTGATGSGPWIELATVALAVGGLAVLLGVAGRMRRADRDPAARRAPTAGAWCLTAAALITLGAVITEGLGLDFTLGAFLAGVVVGSDRWIPQRMVRPLRTVVLGVLAPLFLAVNGLTADLRLLADPALAVTAVIAVVLAVLTKTAGAYAGGRLSGLTHDEAVAVGSALNARGTVQLVVAAAGLQLGLITPAGFTVLVVIALVTSAMAGPLIRRFQARVPENPTESRRAGG